MKGVLYPYMRKPISYDIVRTEAAYILNPDMPTVLCKYPFPFHLFHLLLPIRRPYPLQRFPKALILHLPKPLIIVNILGIIVIIPRVFFILILPFIPGVEGISNVYLARK